MFEVKSKYKFFGGFGIMILVLLFVSFTVFIDIYGQEQHFIEYNSNSEYSIYFVLLLWLGVAYTFTKTCKYIVINPISVKFINPLLPFISKTVDWTEYDFYILVDEKYNNKRSSKTYETIWLIKNNRKKRAISSAMYSNYEELKQALPIPSKGKKYFNQFMQGLYKIGFKINPNKLW